MGQNMNTEFAREKMIEQQVRAWDVVDHEVLEVLGEVPREQFVPRDYASLAFSDTEIPIGYGEYMMTPTVEGRILQALDLTCSDKVLEIGTGTGFLTACLATITSHVTSIEIHEKLLKRARENLADAGIDNIDLLKLDATQELPSGRYDVVVVSGSLYRFDPRYVEKLVAGGRLFVVIGNAPIMDARIVHRTGDSDWVSESIFETCLAPLVNAAPPPRFIF
jgi:protein-L-isoaspartate(D-aspartate) O-methyltransferase